jgi:hypothetical protein
MGKLIDSNHTLNAHLSGICHKVSNWKIKIGCSLSCGQRIYSLYMSHRPWILSQCHLVGVGTSSEP